jgi:hypothetical protein
MRTVTGAQLLRWILPIRTRPCTTARRGLADGGHRADMTPSRRKLPVLFERCGLKNIRHEATAEAVRGGSLWARWWQETLEAIRTWEQAGGVLTEAREEEYEALTAPWSDPSFWFLTALLHACWGQRW